MSIRLNGQVAVATGSGHGMGRCHTIALAARGPFAAKGAKSRGINLSK